MTDKTFHINAEEVDVEEIMKEVEANIARRKTDQVKMPDLEEVRKNVHIRDDYFSGGNLKKQDMNINFLDGQIVLDQSIASERKFVGKFIVLFKRLIRKSIYWYMRSVFDQQIDFNRSTAQNLNKISMLLQELEDSASDSQQDSLKQEVQLKTLEKKQQDSEKKYQNLKRELALAENRIKKLDRKLESLQPSDTIFNHSPTMELDFNYLNFEEKYRGSFQEIKEKQKVYLEYFKGKSNVLDIGCGRGEFVELLQENKISVKGIDLSQQMVDYCLRRGLPVEKQEGISYLEQQEDNSLGGIFMAQVIEHLEPNDMIYLIRLAYKKLLPGAFLVAETLNPQCLLVFTESYFMDPSHIRMVHPYSIKFIMESEGYDEVDIKYLSKVEEDFHIPRIQLKCRENMEDFNLPVFKLNNIMYGYREFAAIGRKQG